MNNTRRRVLSMTLVATAALALSACVVAPGRYYGQNNGYNDGYGGYGPGVSVAPPGPQVDVHIGAPGPGHFWIGGHWGWAGHRHVWVPGRWERHRQGYGWQPHRWHQQGGVWRESRGHWRQH